MTVREEPRFWNGWWTFSLLAAIFTILMLLLEGFGVLHDWGLVLSGIGIVITLFGTTTASTRSSLALIDRRLDQMHDTLLHILQILDKRLPDAPR